MTIASFLVLGLPPLMSDQWIKDLFAPYGDIKVVMVPRDMVGETYGYALVKVRATEEAATILAGTGVLRSAGGVTLQLFPKGHAVFHSVAKRFPEFSRSC